MATVIPDPAYLKDGENIWTSDADFYDITWDKTTFKVGLNIQQPTANIIQNAPKITVAAGTPYRWAEMTEEKQTGVATSVIVDSTGSAYAGSGTEGTVLRLGVTAAQTQRLVKNNVITGVNPDSMRSCSAIVTAIVENGASSIIYVKLIQNDVGSAFLKTTSDISWFVSGDAQREFSGAPDAMYSTPDRFENYPQISMVSDEMSGTEMERMFRTDSMEAQDRVRRMLERLKRMVARGMWHGVRLRTQEGKWERMFSGGIRWALETYEQDTVLANTSSRIINFETRGAVNGEDVPWKGMDWDLGCMPFLDWVGETLLASEDDTIDVICGPGAFTKINAVLRAEGYIELETEQSKFGFRVTTLIGFHRNFRLMVDPDFHRIKEYNYSAWFGEIGLLRQALVKNRNLHIVGDLQGQDHAEDNGFTFVDGKKVAAWLEHGYRWNNLKGMLWVDRIGFDNVA